MTALILGALGAACGWHIGAAFMRTGEASLRAGQIAVFSSGVLLVFAIGAGLYGWFGE